jgi:hypothetical protein
VPESLYGAVGKSAKHWSLITLATHWSLTCISNKLDVFFQGCNVSFLLTEISVTFTALVLVTPGISKPVISVITLTLNSYILHTWESRKETVYEYILFWPNICLLDTQHTCHFWIKKLISK